jgi:hypothetical protein
MLHLENAARKVADAHLHMPIRGSETLPTAQQVNCGQQLGAPIGNCSDNTVTEGTALVEINAPGGPCRRRRVPQDTRPALSGNWHFA